MSGKREAAPSRWRREVNGDDTALDHTRLVRTGPPAASRDTRGALGVGEVTHLPAHPGEEQCALDEGKSRRGRLGDRVFWPSVSPEPCGDEAFPLVEAPRRGRA